MSQSHRIEPKFSIAIAMRSLSLFLASLVLVIPAWADKAKDEETLRNAATVLSAMVDSNTVPQDTLSRANCVIILPSVKKGGFIVGGSGGRGPMLCRTGKDFKGAWSAPAMYTIGGASVGLQIGGSATDFVVLVMSAKGMNAILEGKTKLGNDATIAAGPSGATSSGTVGGTDMVSYGRASGLFAGMSLGGATLSPDDSANQNLYGKAITAKEIVTQNGVRATPGGQPLISLLNAKAGKLGN
jgi:lipid-binding SYLF domain-containing protein